MDCELVSVVIPTYNRAYCIERAIDSVLVQTHQALDIIVIDDGSTDNTAELIARRYGAEPRVRYLWQSNKGVCAARNRGLGVVRGDYIALLDSDDVWKPWKLELQLCCLRAIPEAGMIWTDMEAIDPEGELVSPSYLRTMYSAYRWFAEDTLFSNSRALTEVCPPLSSLASGARLYWGDIFSPMVMGNLVHTSTVLIARQRLEHVGGFNEALTVSGEDYDFHLRTCREGPVAFVNLSSIQYQIGRSDQLSHPKYTLYTARNFLATIEPILANERDRLALPPHMIAAAQAHAYRWIGAEHFDLGDQALARTHLRKSLGHRAWQPKIWMLYMLTLLPPVMCRTVIGQLRALKRSLRASYWRALAKLAPLKDADHAEEIGS
jgi:GT2 family glycosyltransferase